MVDKMDERELQLQEAMSLDIKSLNKSPLATSLIDEAATQSKPHENLGAYKADYYDRADTKGKRKTNISIPKSKSHLGTKASIDDFSHHDHQARPSRRQEAPSRSVSESNGGGKILHNIMGLTNSLLGNNHHGNSNKSLLVSSSSGGMSAIGSLRSGELSFSDDLVQRPNLPHNSHEMIPRVSQDALPIQQRNLHSMYTPDITIHSQGVMYSDQGITAMYSSNTITGGGRGYPPLEYLPGPAAFVGGGRQCHFRDQPIDSDLYNNLVFFDDITALAPFTVEASFTTAAPFTNNESRSKNPSPSSSKSKSAATTSDAIKHAKQELQRDRDQYQELITEFHPSFQFNEKLLEMILSQMNETNIAECMENYRAQVQKQYADASIKLIEAMAAREKKDNAASLEMEATIKKLEEEIASQNQTSLEIQEKLQEKSVEVQVDRKEIAQDYKSLKENITSYFEEEQVDSSKKKKEQYIKDMMQLLIEKIIQCHPLQQSVSTVQTLFNQSGHDKWIEQIKLQVVQSLYVSSKATEIDRTKIQEIKDKCLSEFEARNDIAFKDRKSPYLEESIIIAERLSKYAVAESFYFPDGLPALNQQ